VSFGGVWFPALCADRGYFAPLPQCLGVGAQTANLPKPSKIANLPANFQALLNSCKIANHDAKTYGMGYSTMLSE